MKTVVRGILISFLIMECEVYATSLESENGIKSHNLKNSTYNHNNGPVYISMEKENLVKYKDRFKVDNRKILLFYIDGTLYKIKEELTNLEIKSYEVAYNKVRDPVKGLPFSVFFANCVNDPVASKDGVHILQYIYDEFDITPYEFECKRGDSKYEDFVERDEKLIEYLRNSTSRLWCFTNGFEPRAKAILKKLDVEQYFEGVICVDLHKKCPIKKPYLESYEFVEELLGVKDRKQIYFFDDVENNLKVARERGWNTIYVEAKDEIVELVKQESFN